MAVLLLVLAVVGCGYSVREREADRAEREGQTAGAAGLSRELNPYPADTNSDWTAEQRRRWFSGHNSGVMMRIAAKQEKPQ